MFHCIGALENKTIGMWNGYLFICANILLGEASTLVKVSEVVSERLKLRSNKYIKRTAGDVTVEELVGLDQGEDLVQVDSELTSTGAVSLKFKETYHGIPVYGVFATVEIDQDTNEYTGQSDGHVISDIGEDINSIKVEISEEHATKIALEHATKNITGFQIDNFETNLFVCMGNGTAILMYDVSFRIRQGHSVTRPGYFINAKSGEIIKIIPKIKSYRMKSVGGNIKTGKYMYGKEMPYLQVKREGSVCSLENDFIAVYHMHNTLVVPDKPFSFNCTAGISDESNGAFSPLSDAYYYGTAIFSMFKEWIHMLPVDHNKLPLKIYVHNDVHDSAHFDPNIWAVIIGDGVPQRTYPYAIVDVIGHEIGHSFADQHPNLEYIGQSGGICESLVDIIGECAQWYSSHIVDLVAGGDLYVHGMGRRLCEQNTDGKSIINVAEYRDDMNVHYSSGIFNHFACQLNEVLTWREIFSIVTYASRFYWSETTSFNEGGCGIVKAAYDLGYDLQPIDQGLLSIGLEPCNIDNHIRLISNHMELHNLSAESVKHGILFMVRFDKLPRSKNSGSRIIQIVTSGGVGDVDLYVGPRKKVSKKNAIYSSTMDGNAELLYIEELNSKNKLYLKLVPKLGMFSGVQLNANIL